MNPKRRSEYFHLKQNKSNDFTARSNQIKDNALHTFYLYNNIKETTLSSTYAIFKPLWKTQVLRHGNYVAENPEANLEQVEFVKKLSK